MARIAGIDIPRNKRVIVPLTCIYDIGNTTARKVLANVGVFEDACVRDLTDEQTDAIRAEVDKLETEGGLRHGVNLSVKHLMEIGLYRGIRHRRELPARRQNTENNTHTRKGSTKAVTSEEK